MVTLQVGGFEQSFVVTAPDDAAARELLARHEAQGDRKHYPGVKPGSRVDVVWRNVALLDYTLQPIPGS